MMVCFNSSGEVALSAFLCRTKSSWICCVAKQSSQKIGRRNPGPNARTSEIVSVTSIFPVFALNIKRRNASNLSVDGRLMSDFGLYKSHVRGTLRGKVTSVCKMQVNSGITLRATAVFFRTWKRALFDPSARTTKLISVGKENSLKGNL